MFASGARRDAEAARPRAVFRERLCDEYDDGRAAERVVRQALLGEASDTTTGRHDGDDVDGEGAGGGGVIGVPRSADRSAARGAPCRVQPTCGSGSASGSAVRPSRREPEAVRGKTLGMRAPAHPFRHPTPYQFFGTLVWLAMSLAYWRDPLGRAAVTGPASLLVLLTGIGRLTRTLTDARRVTFLGLFTLAVLWAGDGSWAGGGLGHPSTPAVGLTCWAWAWTGTRAGAVRCPVRYVGPSGLRSPWGYAWLGALYALILLLDPVTFVAAAVGAVALVAGWERDRRAAVASRWALTAAVPLTAAYCCGPYVGLLALTTGNAGARPAYERLPHGAPGYLWLVLLCVSALWLRAWQVRRAWRVRRTAGH